MPQTSQKHFLAKYAETKDEKELIDASDDILLMYRETKDLIDTIAMWKFMVGSNNMSQSDQQTAVELAALANFIKETYGDRLNLKQVNHAIKLSMKEELEIDVRNFNQFTPLYISRILNSYIEHYIDSLNILKQRFDRDFTQIEQPKPTPEKIKEDFIDILKSTYETFKNKGEIYDAFNYLYNFFKSKGMLTLNQATVNDAMEYGKRKSIEQSEKYRMSNNLMNINAQNSDSIIKSYARSFCVQKLFSEMQLDEIISRIELEDFDGNNR